MFCSLSGLFAAYFFTCEVTVMNLLTGNIRRLYFKYLAAAFGSTLITSVYSLVDMAMVGQYHGPDGTAALAVVAPIWNIIYGLGLLTGIGGSVIYSIKKGGAVNKGSSENKYFTATLIFSLILALISWGFIVLFEKQLLMFFGANEALLDYALRYMRPIKFVLPLFLFNQMLAAFLRNDSAPELATIGVLAGGAFNVLGDYFFVFACDMGVYGAGLATAIGSVISFLVLLSHFFSKKCTLRLVRCEQLFGKFGEISVSGFSSFFVDFAMGILTVLFNRQIMKYLGTNALAVYGPIINISTFVQCCAYGVGQAAQPIISTNFGASKGQRIKDTLRYALYSTAFFGIFWTALSLSAPNLYIHIFMSPTEEVLRIAPAIIRAYSLSFLLLPFNIFSTYYFQSIMRPSAAFIVSVSRGMVISGVLIILIPLIMAPDLIWFAMPVTELVTAIYAGVCIKQYTDRLGCMS